MLNHPELKIIMQENIITKILSTPTQDPAEWKSQQGLQVIVQLQTSSN